jgi:uncharacterized damage-inducible protein DinB
MQLKETLLAQIERESAGSRKALEAVPEGKNDWRPHPKSMPLGSLAALVASMPSWVSMIVEKNELDLSTGEGAQKPVSSTRELLQIHDKAMQAARKSMSNATEDQLMKSWRLLWGQKVLDDRPRHLVVADTISHLAHHRGQLTVYLRLNDRPVPAIYGASADESW